MANNKNKYSDRSRGWAFIVYPDSAPSNWRDIVDQFHVAWAESPLHCFDVDPTGEVKKAHWHVVLAFDSVKSEDQILDLIAPLNCSYPKRLNSIRGMVRYFAHLDNPEKYQYPVDQIIGHGGMDVGDFLRLSSSDRYRIIKKMMVFCRDNNITEFYELMDIAMEEHFEDWFPLLCDNSAYIISQYLKSLQRVSQ